MSAIEPGGHGDPIHLADSIQHDIAVF